MDLVFDSDLSDVSDVELSDQECIRPYRFEPLVNEREETSDSEEMSEVEIDEPIAPVSTWCQCNNCTDMPTVTEAICCRSINVVDGKIEENRLGCITGHDGFRANCLNLHVLEVAYYDHVIQSGPPEEDQRIHELYRHLAYRRFIRWVYGLLGKRVRKVIPSCAVTAIRNAFPSEEYCGFKYPQ